MAKILRVCRLCNLYTLQDRCPSCSKATSCPHPPKYSPQDKYAKYRRKELF